MNLLKISFLVERMILGYGVDLVTHKLAEGLTETGFDVEVLCCFHDSTYLGYNYAVKAIPARPAGTPWDYEKNTYESVAPMVKDSDVLIIGTFPFFLTGYLSQKPWIAIDFGVVPPNWFSGRRRREFEYIHRSQYGKYFHRAKMIVCISEFLKSRLPQALQDKARVIYLGVDHYPDEFLTDIRSLYKLKGTVLLYVGRCMDTAPYKNVNKLLEVYHAIKGNHTDTTLLISAGDCNVEEIERLESGNAVVIAGALNLFLPSIYNSCDIFVTATQWEGFNLPLLEASYFGKPVVAYDIGPHSEIVVHGKTGFLARSDGDFTDYLTEVIKSPSMRERMGREGEKFAQSRFRWEKVVREYADLIHKCTSSK